MPAPFQTIGLIGKYRKDNISETLLTLFDYLKSRQLTVFLEQETTANLISGDFPSLSRQELAKQCDLFIVVGGDGSLLTAARHAANNDIPVLGINRGRLGFLTDIYPHEIATKVGQVLEGNYLEEKRFLLSAQIGNQKVEMERQVALNDVVLLPGAVAHMIEFEIYVNKQFVCSLRADGLITATPTGSTAYALSGGGPILHPSLDAIVLVPMFPHTLSSRPIVIAADSLIEIKIADYNETALGVSCDGQKRIPVAPGESIIIQKQPEKLRLIHPPDYQYFATLRSKLHWETKLGQTYCF